MKILVCVKRVPLTEVQAKIAPDQKRLDTSGYQYMLSFYDEIALEEAVRTKERRGGEVVVATVGPADATKELRECLAKGADEAILLKDESWMELARIIRANVLSLKRREFVEAAQTIGARGPRIIARHILPNTLAPIVVAATLGVGNALLTEASVSYLGLGVQPPEPSWGNMLYNAQSYFFNAPWITLYPGIMILITVLCINFIGDGLRDALDPRMKER